MSVDEYLFGKVAKYWKSKRRSAQEAQEQAVQLADLRPQLSLLACAISGSSIEIFPAEEEGGYKNNVFFLPESCALFPDKTQNKQYYQFRILYLCMQKSLGFNWQGGGEKPLEQSRQLAIESAEKVLARLFAEFPVTKPWHECFLASILADKPEKKVPALHLLYGKWMTNDPESKAGLMAEPSNPAQAASGVTPKTTLKARIVEEIVQLQVDKKAQEDYMLTHNFEKVETADEFSGVWRDFDGDDELESHADALDELSMKYTVRVDDPAHSVYQADFLENTTVSESADSDVAAKAISYPEWDYSKRAYKTDFCKLYPKTVLDSDASYYQQTIRNYSSILNGLRKMLTSVNNRMMQQRRQTQGDAFDMDSVTDLFVDIKTGHTPSDKIYLSNRKKEKDLSVLLLLDVSLSSDGYAEGNRIIDVEKQVSILFGEILDEFGIDFSIQSFYSKTRNHCQYLTLKGFDDNWGAAKMRVGVVQPAGYTRIGTALRHSGALLNARETKNKWLVLVSDGKPNDYDRYEGRYGIQDVKQALRELNEQQISAYALAIEATAKHYLPQMFGQNNYQILSSPEALLQAMVKWYDKIRNQS